MFLFLWKMEIRYPSTSLKRHVICLQNILGRKKNEIIFLPNENLSLLMLKNGCNGKNFNINLLQFCCKYIWRLNSSKPRIKFHFTWMYFFFTEQLFASQAHSLSSTLSESCLIRQKLGHFAVLHLNPLSWEATCGNFG